MQRSPWPSLAILGLCIVTLAGIAANVTTPRSAPAPSIAPELPALPASAWLNSEPLTLAALRGRPVLIEFWTFDCSNCRNTLPWVKAINARYGPKGLQVIAIHSPELEHERDPAAVAAHVRQLAIQYPVLVDNDFSYWSALANRFWPAFYLIDPQGRIVTRRVGELHTGEHSADEFEREIALLLPHGWDRATERPDTAANEKKRPPKRAQSGGDR